MMLFEASSMREPQMMLIQVFELSLGHVGSISSTVSKTTLMGVVIC